MSKKANKTKMEVGDDIVKKNIKIAFKWREINMQKMENSKNDLPRRIEVVKANQRKIFLHNMRQVRIY